MSDPIIKAILSANVYDAAVETPLQEARFLSKRLNNTVLIKREDLQPVYSFKIRGAFNKMRQLSKEKLANGVVAASAGNHAQGVAYSAKKLGCQATIVMPETTPSTKVNGVKSWGGKVVLVGDTFDEAAAYAQALTEEKGMEFIPPYDDLDVIAGQGTIGVELLKQHAGPIDRVFLPVGGGGLAAGVAKYIKYVRPDVKIIAVEPEDAACLALAMKDGKRNKLKEVGLFADGVAVAQIGKKPFEILRDLVDEVVTATTDDICDAIKDIFEDTRSIAEPAGALSLAGLKNYVKQYGIENESLITIESGANTNFDRLRYICERSQVGENKEAIFSVQIPEKPGSFKKLCSLLGKRNISEFNYRYMDARQAQIFIGLQLKHSEERRAVMEKLEQAGYKVDDFTDNDMAKDHVRHMVGGKSTLTEHEQVYSFIFPERPGALMNFLNQMDTQWNISMFHYRNHGAAWGRVLAGIQVDKANVKTVTSALDELGYPYMDESVNPAYQAFLAALPEP